MENAILSVISKLDFSNIQVARLLKATRERSTRSDEKAGATCIKLEATARIQDEL